jgi:16S rRNA U1498 N3-methylase RsmE
MGQKKAWEGYPLAEAALTEAIAEIRKQERYCAQCHVDETVYDATIDRMQDKQDSLRRVIEQMRDALNQCRRWVVPVVGIQQEAEEAQSQIDDALAAAVDEVLK